MNLDKAIAFMKAKHKDQKRKNGSEYFLHPLRVAESVKELGVEYELAALFHDLLEDTDATEEEIRELSNDAVLAAVKLVTKDDRSKDQYINDILSDPIAKAVKNADRIDNLTEALTGEKSFVSNYLDETRKYYLGRFSTELDEAYARLDRTYYKYDSNNTVNDLFRHALRMYP